MTKIAGVEIKEPKSLEEVMGLDKYLAGLQDKLSKESVALLFEYLNRDKSILFDGALINVKRKVGKSLDSFVVYTEGDDRIAVNPKTIDRFRLMDTDVFHAHGYDDLKKVRKEVSDARATVNQARSKYVSKPVGWKQWVRQKASHKWQYFRAKAPDLGIDEKLQGVIKGGFGGRARKYRSVYHGHIRKGLAAAGLGAVLTASLLALILSGSRTGSGGIDSPTSRGGSAAAGEHWDPYGRSKKDPTQSEKPKEEESDLEKLQKKHLGQGEIHPPERMRDVRKKYLELTEIIQVPPEPRTDLSSPEPYFPPTKLEPYALGNEGTASDKPEIDGGNRALLLIMDVTGSMMNPEGVLTGGPVAPGYLLATQLIKSYASAGAPIKIIRYPVDKVSEESIIQTNSMDAALEALLYNEGGAKDDANAIDRVATLYLTAMKNANPMDVVFITDARPTQNGCLRFMDLERRNRGKDSVSWVNTIPCSGEARIENEVDNLNGANDERYRFFSVDTVDKAKETAKKIIKRYTK